MKEVVANAKREFAEGSANYFTFSHGDKHPGIPRLNDTRISVTPKGIHASLTVRTDQDHTNRASCEGSLHISEPGNISEKLDKQRNKLKRSYDLSKLFDLPGGGKLLVLTGYHHDGGTIDERRCVMEQNLSGSAVTLDLFDLRPKSKSDWHRTLKLAEQLIDGIRFNIRSLPTSKAVKSSLSDQDSLKTRNTSRGESR